MSDGARLLFLANWPLRKDPAEGYAFFTHWSRKPRLTLMGTFALGAWTRWEKARLRFYILAPLVAYFRSFFHDAVIAYSSQVGLPLAFLFRLTGRRTPLVVFDVESLGRVGAGWRLGVARFAARRFDRLVYAASRQRGYYERRFPDLVARARFVPIGIGEYPRRRPDVDAGDGPIVAPGHHGRAFRDWATLLKAHAALADRAPLLIAGRSDLPEEERGGVPLHANVRFAPFAPAPVFQERIEDAPFVVVPLPEREHSLGQLTVLFCMAMGRAVIATRVMGVEDYIEDGVTGLLIPPGDPEALGEAMGALWADRARCAAMGRAAYDRYRERFNDRRMGEDWEAVMNEALPKGRVS